MVSSDHKIHKKIDCFAIITTLPLSLPLYDVRLSLSLPHPLPFFISYSLPLCLSLPPSLPPLSMMLNNQREKETSRVKWHVKPQTI